MKEYNLSNWVKSLPLSKGMVTRTSQEVEGLLAQKLSSIKSSEDWRLTNIGRFKEFFNTPLTSMACKLRSHHSRPYLHSP